MVSRGHLLRGVQLPADLPLPTSRRTRRRPSTFGVCDFALSWWIKHGHAGELDLTDRKVVMVGSYNDDEPGSPWTVALLIDDEANLAQQTALAGHLPRTVGGTPSRNYTPAIQSVASVSTAVVRLDHNRRHWRIWVEGRVDVAADEEVHSEEPVACGIPGLDQPGQESARQDPPGRGRTARVGVVGPVRVRDELRVLRRPLGTHRRHLLHRGAARRRETRDGPRCGQHQQSEG